MDFVELLREAADGALDPEEDALIRKLGALIYVTDRERMLARQRVLARRGGNWTLTPFFTCAWVISMLSPNSEKRERGVGDYRGLAMRTLTTGGGGGSFARRACSASVISFRFLTAAEDMSGSFGIGAVSGLLAFHRTILGPDKGRRSFHPTRRIPGIRRFASRRPGPPCTRVIV